jgi:hypothetical protein
MCISCMPIASPISYIGECLIQDRIGEVELATIIDHSKSEVLINWVETLLYISPNQKPYII